MVAIPAIEGGLYMVPWMIVGGRLDAMASSTTERAILVLAGSLGRKVPPIGYMDLFGGISTVDIYRYASIHVEKCRFPTILSISCRYRPISTDID